MNENMIAIVGTPIDCIPFSSTMMEEIGERISPQILPSSWLTGDSTQMDYLQQAMEEVFDVVKER
jgi:hypothetical protein